MQVLDHTPVDYGCINTDYSGLPNKEKSRVKSGYYNKPPQEPALEGVEWDEDFSNKCLRIKL